MYNTDFTNLSRKQLMKHFEQERQEWLDAGMSEADIFRVHFGEIDENGRGGDYRIWLDERKHSRTDHKYAQGGSLSYCDNVYDDRKNSSRCNEIENLELSMDMEGALSILTELQRRYSIYVIIYGYTYTEVAQKYGVSEAAIRKHVKHAKQKMKVFFC